MCDDERTALNPNNREEFCITPIANAAYKMCLRASAETGKPVSYFTTALNSMLDRALDRAIPRGEDNASDN